MSDPVARDRQAILAAQERGGLSILGTYVRLSGPGWLQSAITLGGGSLAGSLFLGILGGTSLLWLQLVAIAMGVVMLSAISYVTLSTGERPFRAINRHINPVLGWGWLIATMMANMIWCMPQFSLCFGALRKNLVGESTLGDDNTTKLTVSVVLLAAAGIAVFLNSRPGLAARLFDWFLKALVGVVVICFFCVVALLTSKGALDWDAVLAGFIPDFSQWTTPTGEIATLIGTLPDAMQTYWSRAVVVKQREVMIAAAATAVGINMTFLMPYTLLNRGWDRTFRGLARFDLSTGMAIPYVLVTSCVVIAAAAKFHAQVDEAFLSTDPETMQQSTLFEGAKDVMVARLTHELGEDAFAALSEDEQFARMAKLSEAEKRIASSLVKRNAFDLSKSLAPLLGEQTAQRVFGLGVFGMGFSSIIILMLINGFAVCEMFNRPLGGSLHVVGCLIAGVCGAMWWLVWTGDSKVYLAIIASSFGAMLLPIAYLTFFMMMNSRKILGDQKLTGGRMALWNFVMLISVAGAIVAAGTAIMDKMSNPETGTLVVTIAGVYGVLVVLGFLLKPRHVDG